MATPAEAPVTTETPAVVETTTEATTSTEEEPTTFDKEYVEKLRKEAAEWRTKLREKETAEATLKAKLDEIERNKLSEQDRLKLEWEEAKTGLNNSKVLLKQSFLESAVAKNALNFELVDVDATIRLLDSNSVEYGDDGRPTNIADVLGTTLEKYPFLKSVPKKTVPPVDTGTTNPGRQKGSTALTREAISRMSQAEITSRRAEIDAWMARGYKN